MMYSLNISNSLFDKIFIKMALFSIYSSKYLILNIDCIDKIEISNCTWQIAKDSE